MNDTPADRLTDVALAAQFLQELTRMPRLARFAPQSDEARARQALQQGGYVRRVLNGDAARSDALATGKEMATRGIPMTYVLRRARHHLLAELRREARASNPEAMLAAVTRVFDELVWVSEAHADEESARLDAIREFDRTYAAHRGTQWFQPMVDFVRGATGADVVFVGEMTEQEEAVSILALSSSDPAARPFTYALAGTPCAQVLSGGACVYPHRVMRSFPDDELLVEMGVEGYVGVPMYGGSAVPIGLIVALFARPVPEIERTTDTLERFSRRAAVELFRQRHEAAIQRERHEFRRMLLSLPDPAAVHQDGRLMWVNEQTVKSFGYERSSDLIGASILTLVHPSDHAAVTERISAMAATGQPAPPRPFRLRRADGSEFTLELVASPLVRDGEPSFVVIGREMSERIRRQHQARHLDRRSLLSSVNGSLSHEINNPLTFMLANLEFAAEEVQRLSQSDTARISETQLAEIGSTVRGHLAEVAAGCHRIGAAVRAMQGVVPGDVRPAAPSRLGPSVDAAIATIPALTRGEVQLTQVRECDAMVPVERLSLELALTNVLRNAVEALARQPTPTGNWGPHIWLTCRAYDGDVVITIEDNGPGISSLLVETLFEPFVTTKMRGLTTGQGLTVTRDIVERVGGSVTAENRVGGGSPRQPRHP